VVDVEVKAQALFHNLVKLFGISTVVVMELQTSF
jgi:hypothetical protein